MHYSRELWIEYVRMFLAKQKSLNQDKEMRNIFMQLSKTSLHKKRTGNKIPVVDST